MSDGALIVTTISFVVVLIAGLAWGFHQTRVGCEQKGGELISVYKGSLCVSSDGRILR